MFLRSACVVALSALTALQVGAQQPADVPRDLMIAYVRAMNQGDGNMPIDIAAGSVPTAYQALVLLPPSFRINGTVSAGRFVTVLASAVGSPDSVLRQIAGEYGRAGWSALSRVSMQGSFGAPGGFRPAPSAAALTLFCHEGHEVNSSATPASDGFTLVQLRVQAISPTCGRLPAALSASPPPQPRSPLPLLRNPDDAGMRPECFVNGSGQRSDALVTSSLTPAAMFEHYAKQLESQGWTRLPETPIARASFSRRDTTGVQEVATLTVTANSAVPICRNATIEVTTIRKP